MDFNQKYQNANTLQDSGEYTKAIDVFKKILASSPDKAYEGKVKILIADNLHSRNQEGDTAESVRIYKEVVHDTETPAYVRAMALIGLAFVVRGESETFYKTYFTEEPYAFFLPTTGTESAKISTAYLRLLQLSDVTSANSYAEYLIAGAYYAPLLINKNLPGTTTPQQAAKIMQEYVKKADILISLDESLYKSNIILARYFYRAVALNASNRILNNVSLQEREDAFKMVLKKGESDESSSNSQAVSWLMWGRFYYANFILEYFDKKRYPDIVDILEPFTKATSGSDALYRATRIRFISSLTSGSGNEFARTRAVALAKISPEFAEFLTSISFTQ